MRLLLLFVSIACSFLLWTCQNIDDATPSKRHTFIRLHEGPYSITANDLEIVADGYVIVGTMKQPTDSTDLDVAVIFKTDFRGNRIGNFKTFNGYSAKSIIHYPGGGYIVVGDSIKTDLTPNFVVDGTISSARIMILGEELDSLYSYTYKDDADSLYTDFYAESVTLDDNNNIIVLGSFINVTSNGQNHTNDPEKPFLLSLTRNGNSLSLNWKQDYDLINRNYKNARSVHTKNTSVIWASGIAQSIGDVTISYVDIPFVEQNSVFLNSSTIGENQNQLFIPNDIQPATSDAFGYGVVGTYSEANATDGSKANMFFLRVNTQGTIDENSVIYFDAKDGVLADSTQSSIIDEGQALTSTYDGGFVIAGTMETIPGTGNGGRDIFLAKIDAFNKVVWLKTIGGSGDEDVCTIKETSDNGLLICGTNTIGGYSVVFLLKTDKTGKLIN